jgi:hypothetical protein
MSTVRITLSGKQKQNIKLMIRLEVLETRLSGDPLPELSVFLSVNVVKLWFKGGFIGQLSELLNVLFKVERHE